MKKLLALTLAPTAGLSVCACGGAGSRKNGLHSKE